MYINDCIEKDGKKKRRKCIKREKEREKKTRNENQNVNTIIYINKIRGTQAKGEREREPLREGYKGENELCLISWVPVTINFFLIKLVSLYLRHKKSEIRR